MLRSFNFPAFIMLSCIGISCGTEREVIEEEVILEDMAVRSITVSQNGYNLVVEPIYEWPTNYDAIGAIDIRNVRVEVREGAAGTYIDVSGTSLVGNDPFGFTQRIFNPHEVVLYVATVKQKQAWDHFLVETERNLYSPRDVLPPKVSLETQ